MPGINGLELAEKAEKSRPDLPVLLMGALGRAATGFAAFANAEEAVSLGRVAAGTPPVPNERAGTGS